MPLCGAAARNPIPMRMLAIFPFAILLFRNSWSVLCYIRVNDVLVSSGAAFPPPFAVGAARCRQLAWGVIAC